MEKLEKKKMETEMLKKKEGSQCSVDRCLLWRPGVPVPRYELSKPCCARQITPLLTAEVRDPFDADERMEGGTTGGSQ